MSVREGSICESTLNLSARIGLGSVAGAAATYLSDAVSELIYTDDIARREHEVQQKSATQVLAQNILQSLGLNPSDKDIERVAPLLHWAFGVICGSFAGAFARGGGARSSMIVATGMLAFDEVGLTLLGAAPPSTRYPWQTNLRSLLSHAAYGVSLTMAYEVLRSVFPRNED